MKARVPTSVLLNELLRDAEGDRVTLAWLMESLGSRSFGLVMLLLALLSLVPGASGVAGVLLAILAVQMLLGRAGPAFPRFVAERRFSTRGLARALGRVVPVLRYLESFVHPRWPTPFETTKRGVGFIMLVMGALLLTPVPLSNFPLGVAVALIAFAYLEEDGLLLCIALGISALLLVVTAGIAWQAMSELGWMKGLL